MNSFVANNGLIVPGELARFALAYLAIALVPGYAMATLARPRSDWIERLALAIPCAYTLVALSGLATALLHLPFGLPAYAALALPITLAGAWVMWRKPAGPGAARERWWLVPLGVAVVQGGLMAV